MVERLQGPALTDYIRRAENAHDKTASILELLKGIRDGQVDVEAVRSHYKTQEMPKLNAMVSAFGNGKLYACQRQDFPAWVRGDHHAADMHKMLEFKATCGMCGINAGEQDPWRFGQDMIFRHPNYRRWMQENHGDAFMRGWSQNLRDHGWNW